MSLIFHKVKIVPSLQHLLIHSRYPPVDHSQQPPIHCQRFSIHPQHHPSHNKHLAIHFRYPLIDSRYPLIHSGYPLIHSQQIHLIFQLSLVTLLVNMKLTFTMPACNLGEESGRIVGQNFRVPS